MSNEQLIQEAQDCVQWLKSKDIDAYNDAETVYIILENEDETHIMIDNSERSYRASLWNELDSKEEM